MSTSTPTASFVMVAESPMRMPGVLRAAFEHPWVASYQIGFGPPLVRATPELTERVRGARSVLEKLDVYLEICLLDPEQRSRLASAHQRLITRARGPVEAEELDAASTDALDLSLRLSVPSTAPPKAQPSLQAARVDPEIIPRDAAPECLSGRFYVRLSDPFGQRLLEVPEVGALADRRFTDALAIELRADPTYGWYWEMWLEDLANHVPIAWTSLGDPVSRARRSQDGEAR